MTIEEVRDFKHAEPFRPFEIVMKNGRVVRVFNPFGMALSPSGKTVAVYQGEAVAFLHLPQIAKLRPYRAGTLKPPNDR